LEKAHEIAFLRYLFFLALELLSRQDKGTGSPVAAYTELPQFVDTTGKTQTHMPTDGWIYGAVEANRCQIFVK
jgi:hypothetical protein